MLYNQVTDQLFVIDVSQSVEHDHPFALTFLRKDCTNINDFFKKRHSVSTMTVKELFEFVTDPTITEANIDEYLDQVQQCAVQRSKVDLTQQDLVDEEVFKHVFIPRTLDEVIDFEGDAKKAQDGIASDVYYPMVTGLKQDLSGAKENPDILEGSLALKDSVDGDAREIQTEEDDAEDSSSSGSQSDSEGDSEGDGDKQPEEGTTLTRKEHSKLVKEQNRERRKNKLPKHIKKRKEKVARLRKPKR